MNKQIKGILSILMSILIFAMPITAIAVDVFPQEEEKAFTVSYGSDDWCLLVVFDYPDSEYDIRLVCDMNNDNGVTTSDARTILRAAVKIEALSAENRVLADVNNDGKVSISDARTALRIAVSIQGFPFEFFFTPKSPPTTLGEFLDDAYYGNLDRITSIKANGDFFGSSPEHKELGDIDYIIDVLKNNANSELIYGNPPTDMLQPPDVLWWGDPHKMIHLNFKGGTGEFGFSLVIGKDKDNNTWVWYTPANWSAMLKNDKDAYDIIMGMITNN